MFSRRHYEMIARVLREHAPDHDESVARVAYTLAGEFKRDNPSFSTERFLRASGVPHAPVRGTDPRD